MSADNTTPDTDFDVTKKRYSTIVTAMKTWATANRALSECVAGPDRRVFIKGKNALKFLLESNEHGLSEIATEAAAKSEFEKILKFGVIPRDPSKKSPQPLFLFRVNPDMEEKEDASGKKFLRKRRQRYPDGPIFVHPFGRERDDQKSPGGQLDWIAEGRYMFMVEEDSMWSYVQLGIALGVVFLLTTFPIWPNIIKVGIWYISVTFLLFLLGVIFIQEFVYFLAIPFGVEIVIWPKLWDDNPFEQFIPAPSIRFLSGHLYLRAAVVIGWALVVWWAASQPSEFDEIVSSQKAFVEDLYAGKLLAEGPANPTDKQRHIPTLEEIERSLNEDETEESDDKAPFQDLTSSSSASINADGSIDDQHYDDEEEDEDLLTDSDEKAMMRELRREFERDEKAMKRPN